MKTIRQNTRLQAILQATTLFGFALYFTGAVISGAAYRYVHERHIPMLLFSAVVFFLIGMLKLKKVMQESHWRTSLFNNGYTGVLGYSGKDARSARAGVFSIVVFAVALVGMSASSGIAVRFSQFAGRAAFACFRSAFCSRCIFCRRIFRRSTERCCI